MREAAQHPNWGLDAPVALRRMAIGGAAALVLGLAAQALEAVRETRWLGEIAGMARGIGIGLLLAAALMLWGSKVGKLRMRDRLIAAIPWRGDEQVLDLGCGHGLLLIAAAKHLTTGRAIGIDIWRQYDQADNRPEATRENARLEGVAERVEVCDADGRELPFADASFDVVVSSLALHNIENRAQRAKAVREVARVLRPGGNVAIMDIYHTRQYQKILRECGLVDLRLSAPNFMFVVPTFTVTGRLPARPT